MFQQLNGIHHIPRHHVITWEHHTIILKSILQTDYLNLAPCIQSTLQLPQEKFHQTLIPAVIHHFQTKTGHCL